MRNIILIPFLFFMLGFFLFFLFFQGSMQNTLAQNKPKNYVYPLRPAEKIEPGENQLYYNLSNDSAKIDWSCLDGTLKYIRAEYDCSDFHFVNLIRILYEYGEHIPEIYQKKIKEVLLNFRYWWDEPGENSMCYWSENHQILFASAEYLIGNLYSNDLFPRSNLLGKQHSEKARIRILDWLEMK